MIEPHMTLAILSLRNACERPAGLKDEDAFYQQYGEPAYQRLYRAWRRLGKTVKDEQQRCEDFQTAHSARPEFRTCS